MTAEKRRQIPHRPEVRELVRAKQAWGGPLSAATRAAGFRGWHERGYLPHRDAPGLVQFVTFRLADSFPASRRAEWAALFEIEDDRRRRQQLEAYLDWGRGGCHLRLPGVAKMMEEALRFRHGTDYELRAWCIMPNHVHVLLKVQSRSLSQVIKEWKGFSAKQANRLLQRTGAFWQADYWDTFMRNEAQEVRCRHYIENNPVAAGLVQAPHVWAWSSARFRDNYERLCLPE